MKLVGLVWAQSTSGVIGRGGDIPWRVPEDLTRFKQVKSSFAGLFAPIGIILRRSRAAVDY